MDWPSDNLEHEIDGALRSEGRTKSPAGLYGRVVRAVEAEALLRERRTAWRWRCAAVFGVYAALLVLLPALLGAGNALSAWITSIPGGWGRADQVGYVLIDHLAWIFAAVCVAFLGGLAGIAQGLSWSSRRRQVV